MADYKLQESSANIVDPNSQSVYRYPASLGTPPYEKWILFEVRTARHVGRTGLALEGGAKDSTLAACALYLPDSALRSSQSIEWQTESYGAAAGKAIEGAFQNGTGANVEPKAGTGGGGGSIAGILDSLKSAASDVASVGGAIGASKSLSMIDEFASQTQNYNRGQSGQLGDQLLGAALGKTVNPRTDIFFKNVDYRTHRFDFKLIPRTLQEAQNIDNILNIFHYYSLPSYGGGSGNFFIGYPYEFVITLFTQLQGTHHLNTIGRSVLTSLEVNHAAGNQVAFVDDRNIQQYYPAVTSIELSFKETRLLGRDMDADGKNVIFRGSKNDMPNGPDGKPLFNDPRAVDPAVSDGAVVGALATAAAAAGAAKLAIAVANRIR